MPFAVISDIHGNLNALNLLLNELDVKKIICLGDIVGYNPYSKEVAYFLRSIEDKNYRDTNRITIMNSRKNDKPLNRLKNSIDIFSEQFLNEILKMDKFLYFENKKCLTEIINTLSYQSLDHIDNYKRLLEIGIYDKKFFTKLENIVDRFSNYFIDPENKARYEAYFMDPISRYFAWVNAKHSSELLNQTWKKLKKYDQFESVMGNHDYFIVNGGEDGYCSLPAKIMIKLIRKELTNSELNYLEGLSMSKFYVIGKKSIRFAHAGLEDEGNYYTLFPYIGYEYHEISPIQIMKKLSQDVLIYGHTHENHVWVKEKGEIKDIFQLNKRIKLQKNMLINVGSISEPRDFIGATYMLLYEDETFEFKLLDIF